MTASTSHTSTRRKMSLIQLLFVLVVISLHLNGNNCADLFGFPGINQRVRRRRVQILRSRCCNVRFGASSDGGNPCWEGLRVQTSGWWPCGRRVRSFRHRYVADGEFFRNRKVCGPRRWSRSRGSPRSCRNSGDWWLRAAGLLFRPLGLACGAWNRWSLSCRWCRRCFCDFDRNSRRSCGRRCLSRRDCFIF